MSREIEDGFGCRGLVPTRAEREQDKRDQAERKRFKALEAEISRLRAALGKYGHHIHPRCHDIVKQGSSERLGCLCGFDAARPTLNSEAAP